MKIKYLVLVAYVVTMLFAPACGSKNEEHHNHEEHGHVHESDHEHENDHNHNHEEEHDHEHEDAEEEHAAGDVIVFAPEKAEKYGVETVETTIAPVISTIKVSGEILSAPGEAYTVIAPSAGIVKINRGIAQGVKVGAGTSICSISAQNMTGGDANMQAKINYDAAKRELERIKPLYEDKIVTQREYNAALQTYESAKNAYIPASSASVSAKTAIAGVVTDLYVADGQYVDAGAPIAEINRNSALILRADVPERMNSEISGVRSANVMLADDSFVSLESLNGKRVSAPAAMKVVSGYIPVYFEFNNDGSMPVGSFVQVFLLSESTKTGIQVPVESVVEELGNYYVYVRLDDDCYEKRNVKLGMSDGNNVHITNGLKEVENVVVKGSTYIRLAGNSSAIPAGCEHHHH
ncbi:MAG: efflux RND transporter periplasmic adaptor subunit [Muribaculaceae bacterium]|nr:efflux RND transporter periplasmic adaptor subunit [Muribaculaceae bacterium]